MSLGPPFDASGQRLQERVGAVVVLLLAGAVGWVLAFSGRTVGRGLTVRVTLGSPGPLHTGAKVRLAGREVGEVRAMTLGAPRPGTPGRTVELEVFLARAEAAQVRRNCQPFVATPSVLGEAYLEVGPPPDGAEPGPPVEEGDRLRGADPPDLDRLFQHLEASVRELLALGREHRPELDELLLAGDELLGTWSGLPADRGQLRRILTQGEAALEHGRALVSTLRDTHAIDRARVLGRELAELADRVGPELRDLAARLDLALGRLERLRALFDPAQFADARRALATLRRVLTLGERLVADVQALERRVRAGRGTLGALLQDRELFDDLHETHRIIKGQPLRFLLKTLKPKEPLP